MLTFTHPVAPERVRWIDSSPHHARLIDTPLDIAQPMQALRRRGDRAWIFTSATLGDDEALTWFTRSAALEDARTLRVGSPFDYANNARLYVPPRFPKPNETGHAEAVAELAARCAAALNGRTFVLTTTLRALPVVAETLRAGLDAAGASAYTGSRVLPVSGLMPAVVAV